MGKKRSSTKEPTTRNKYITIKYITELQGNAKIKTLIRKYSKMDVVLAIDYLANAYPRLWALANQKRKIHILKEVLEKKKDRGYGLWEIEEIMKERLGV